jgi:hypothetical protein
VVTKKTLLILAAVGLLAMGMSGCYYPYPPGYGVRVGFGPPAFRAEVALGSPGPGYYWRPGYYDWAGANWAWIGGAWVVPPRPHALWVAPRYERLSRGGYMYHRGHWRY